MPPEPGWRLLGWAEVERVLEVMVSRPRLKKSQYVRERARFCVLLAWGLEVSLVEQEGLTAPRMPKPSSMLPQIAAQQ